MAVRNACRLEAEQSLQSLLALCMSAQQEPVVIVCGACCLEAAHCLLLWDMRGRHWGSALRQALCCRRP